MTVYDACFTSIIQICIQVFSSCMALTKFMLISETQVVCSNEWCSVWQTFWHLTKKQLSFSASTGKNDWDSPEICLEKYNKYPYKKQGGPLLFINMMQSLSSSSERGIKSLQEILEKLFPCTYVSGGDVRKKHL